MREPTPLTRPQKEVLEAVREYVDRYGVAPTYQEIADAVGYDSIGTVAEHLGSLESKGFIEKGENQQRSIRVVGRVELTGDEADYLAQTLRQARGWLTHAETVRMIDESLELLDRKEAT